MQTIDYIKLKLKELRWVMGNKSKRLDPHIYKTITKLISFGIEFQGCARKSNIALMQIVNFPGDLKIPFIIQTNRTTLQ